MGFCRRLLEQRLHNRRASAFGTQNATNMDSMIVIGYRACLPAADSRRGGVTIARQRVRTAALHRELVSIAPKSPKDWRQAGLQIGWQEIAKMRTRLGAHHNRPSSRRPKFDPFALLGFWRQKPTPHAARCDRVSGRPRNCCFAMISAYGPSRPHAAKKYGR
jgi:hypothetical protein